MKQRIIAVHGIAESGKDTVIALMKMHLMNNKIIQWKKNLTSIEIDSSLSDCIENKNDQTYNTQTAYSNIIIERFAKPLKDVIASFIGIDVNDLNDEEIKQMELDPSIWYSIQKPTLTIRDLHTDISDGIKQVLNTDIFASTCLWRCTHNYSQADLIIINDLRYKNELNTCLRNNAYLIKVQRPVADRKRQQTLESGGKIHESERGLSDELFNTIIRNDSTYKDLSVRVLDALYDANLITIEYVKLYKQNM